MKLAHLLDYYTMIGYKFGISITKIPVVIKLLIPDDAETNIDRSLKCLNEEYTRGNREYACYRASKVRTLSIRDFSGMNNYDMAYSAIYTHATTMAVYCVGQLTIPDSYTNNLASISGHGIHFYLTKHATISAFFGFKIDNTISFYNSPYDWEYPLIIMEPMKYDSLDFCGENGYLLARYYYNNQFGVLERKTTYRLELGQSIEKTNQVSYHNVEGVFYYSVGKGVPTPIHLNDPRFIERLIHYMDFRGVL